MTKKFDPTFFTKPVVYVPNPTARGVARIHKWNEERHQYEPLPAGSYYARRYRVQHGGKRARETKCFRELESARKWLAETLPMVTPALHEGLIPLPASSLVVTTQTGPIVGKVLQEWKTDMWPTYREGTIIYYAKTIRAFEPILNVPIEELTPQVIDSWLNGLKTGETGIKFRKSRRTLAKELETLKTIVNWFIDRNDDIKIVSPFKKRHEKMVIVREGQARSKRYMTEEELRLWLSCFDDEMFRIMALTQTKQLFRVSEVSAMKWENVNWDEEFYRVREHVIWPRIGGVEAKIIGGTKTIRAGEFFDVPLRAEVQNELTRWEKQKSCPLIFHDRGNVLTYRQIQYAYDCAFKKAKLTYRATHVCRHTGATTFLEETGDVLALKQMGNWNDMDTALHYGQVLKLRAKTAVKRADANLKQLPAGKMEREAEPVTVETKVDPD